MTLDELKKYDGRQGRPAYAAVGGTIYDLSASALWKNGDHEGLHQAGEDLTEALKGAPHVRALVERFPAVGYLEATRTSGVKRGGSLGMMAAAVLAALLLAWLLLK